nr:helicase-like protein [Tanacetum cinerariifolium]
MSMGGKQDKSVNTGRGPYCYRIQGMNCHRMGALLPDEGKPPIFLQLYIYDTENEIENRTKFASNGESTSSGKNKINHQLTTEIHDMLDTNNPLVAEFQMAGERFVSKKNQNNVRLRLIGTRERDGRKYNLPTASEVAALIVGDFDSMKHKRDIILEEQGGDLQRISELHPSYLALQGKKVVLPSSYTGSPRYMMHNYLDAMTLCNNFGYPDLFIMFTCNPNWPEIALFVAEKGLKSDDRPDLVADVGKLWNEYYKLELSMVRCLSLGGDAARTRDKRGYF